MMDGFYVFEYQLAAFDPQSELPFIPLKRVKMTKINLNQTQLLSFEDAQNTIEFINLHNDITQEKVLFKNMIQQIVKSINDSMVNFVNITLLCDNIKLFTEIIPRECSRRELSVPFVLTNFFDLKELIRKQYLCPYKKLEQVADYLKICTTKEAQTKTQTELLERILKKLYSDKKIISTSEKFMKKCLVRPQEHQKSQIKFVYFKIIGLPFKSFQNQILYILAPEVPQNLKDLCFIYDRQRFSGKGIIKVPNDYQQFLIRKNRMYIGQRYIELEKSTQEQFQKAKVRQEKRSSERSPPREQDQRLNFRNFSINNGNPRNSRSPQQRRRSRQKQGLTRRDQREENMQRVQNIRQNSHHPYLPQINNSEEYGIKVRGLPFAFSEWDVENVFNYYSIVQGSVKLGVKLGTQMKNGQAVILMRTHNDAQKALDMNGYRVMGRYLQVKVISKDQYIKYK